MQNDGGTEVTVFYRFRVPVLAAFLWLVSLVGVVADRLVVYTVNYLLQYFA